MILLVYFVVKLTKEDEMPKPKITKTKGPNLSPHSIHWTYQQEKPHQPMIKFLSDPHRLCHTIPCQCGKVK